MAESGDQLTRFDICRPTRGGLSESLVNGSYTPSGISGILMRVDDPTNGSQSLVTTDQYTAGQLIRVATNQAYTANDTLSLGQHSTQPAVSDGGSLGTTVGQTCAHIPFGSDPSTDVAARTANVMNESTQIHLMDTTTDRLFGVQRNYGSFVGSDLQVYNRSNGGVGVENLTVEDVPSANTSTSATMTYTVDLSGTTTTQTLDNQIITAPPTTTTNDARGSPAVTMDASIAGLFVGISDGGNGVITPISTVENILSAQTITGLRLSALRA